MFWYCEESLTLPLIECMLIIVMPYGGIGHSPNTLLSLRRPPRIVGKIVKNNG